MCAELLPIAAQARMTKPGEKIIVALDVGSKAKALELVAQLRGQVDFFKVGLQLYTAAGPNVVREIVADGAKVFLDLKFHDIPNTVARAVEAAQELGVEMLTVHLSGGVETLRAAVAARKPPLQILGVTVLTSATAEILNELGISEPVENQVERLARIGLAAKVDGLVASGHEIGMLRQMAGGTVKLVVPGVRPKGAGSGDQKRVITPRAALDAGADYVVIGRPIAAASNPRDALARILDELA